MDQEKVEQEDNIEKSILTGVIKMIKKGASVKKSWTDQRVLWKVQGICASNAKVQPMSKQ